jgi:hypothetical protein
MLGAAAEADNHGNWLLCAMLIIWVWSLLIFFVRVWAKLSVKRWGSEDYTVTVAFVSLRPCVLPCCVSRLTTCVLTGRVDSGHRRHAVGDWPGIWCAV